MHRWMSMLNNIGLPQSFHLTYIVEILILTVIIYELLIWVKNTRAWTLLKGIVGDSLCFDFLFLPSHYADVVDVKDSRCACDSCCHCLSAGATACP